MGKEVYIKTLRLLFTIYFHKKLDFRAWFATTDNIAEGMLSIGVISIDCLWWHKPIG